MSKVLLRLGSCLGLAALVLTTTLATVVQAQLPPDPVDIGLPPTPKPIGLPPDPVDIGLPRTPAPIGSPPRPVTVELPPAAKSSGANGQACEAGTLTIVKTDTLQDGRITVPVNVENRPLTFIVDTGGTQTTMKWERVRDLGLAPKEASLNVVGVAGSVMNNYVISSNFLVGELRIKNLPIYLEARALTGADGTLAPDVMRDYDVDIDFARNSLGLLPRGQCPGADRTTSGWTVLPMNVTAGGHVRFTVKLDGRDITAILDTGSAASFISAKAMTLLGIDPKAPELKLLGDKGPYQVFTYPFQSLEAGPVSVKNPLIAIVSDNFAEGSGTDLVLGTNVLRQMHLYIAYGDKRLYITAAQYN